MPYIGNTTSDFSIDTGNITNKAVTATKLSPSSVGSNGQVLSVDGSGNLQWSADASGTALTGSTNNTITTVTGANAIQGEANLTFDGNKLTIANTSSTDANTTTDGAGFNSGTLYHRSRGNSAGIAGSTYSNQIISSNGTNVALEIYTIGATGTPVVFGTNSLERMRIKADGKIGINTTIPTGQLTVKNSDDANLNTIEAFNDNGNLTGSFSQNSAGDGTIGSNKNDGTLSVFFRSNGVSYINGGSVGIGTASPQGNLEIEGNATGPVLAISGGTNSRTAAGILMEGGVNATDNSGIWTKYSLSIGCNQTNAIASRSIDFNNGDTGLGSWLSTGNLQITDGDLAVANGHGIDFSATSDAGGSTNELLDNYEEGTWGGLNGSAVGSATIAMNRYTRIGNQVTIKAYIHSMSTFGSGQTFQLDSLPYTVVDDAVGSCMMTSVNWNESASSYVVSYVWNANMLRLYVTRDDGSWYTIQGNHLSTSSAIFLTLTYMTAA